MSAANSISKDQIMTDKSIPSPASTTPASSNASVESVFVIDECEGVAHAVRAMGLNIGDTIEGREEGPRGIWHEARLTLLWVGQREAVWKEQTRSDEAWEWSEPEESADWSLDGRNWKIISRTEVSRLATGRGWLPIESAPLFTPLDDPIPPCLVYAPGYGVCMGAAGQDKFGHKYACINSVSGSAGDIVTHFMFLPAAPGATSQGVAVAQPDKLREAVILAYGHLWHVNNEPAAPIPMRSPEKAAYEARKVLRDLLTSEERGDGINKVGQLIGRYDAATTSKD